LRPKEVYNMHGMKKNKNGKTVAIKDSHKTLYLKNTAGPILAVGVGEFKAQAVFKTTSAKAEHLLTRPFLRPAYPSEVKAHLAAMGWKDDSIAKELATVLLDPWGYFDTIEKEYDVVDEKGKAKTIKHTELGIPHWAEHCPIEAKEEPTPNGKARGA